MLEWRTVGEQRHVIREHRHDHDGKGHVLTARGWLIWPSRHDRPMVDARVCVQCEVLHDVTATT